jgi:hypothetical protein|tara:strand:- start:1236 stop:1451 length:216 start_codon:yes stop_codon:yes gene_type:complete
MKVVITIEAEINELETECFSNKSDENLDKQTDLIKDIMQMGHFSRHGVNPKINWKVGADAPFNPWQWMGKK